MQFCTSRKMCLSFSFLSFWNKYYSKDYEFYSMSKLYTLITLITFIESMFCYQFLTLLFQSMSLICHHINKMDETFTSTSLQPISYMIFVGIITSHHNCLNQCFRFNYFNTSMFCTIFVYINVSDCKYLSQYFE